MIIKNIILNNFRQFKDNCKIDFSTDKNQNVTIVMGDNGSGKTTLEQAFTWCLFDKNKFNIQDILNKEIEKELGWNNKEAIVSVTLNIENFDFVVIEEMPNNTTKSDLYDREDYWMSVYNSRNPLIGYNLSKARQSGEHHSSQLGEKNNNYGKHHTEKAKSKMKSAWTTERRAALSERNRKRWNEYRLNNIGA